MILGFTFYQILCYFLIYSFLGWVFEVVFKAISIGKVENRGFNNGPVCPIYGFGVLSVFFLISHIESAGVKMNHLYIFLMGLILATLVELIGGFLMDKLFYARWWDYSTRPLNLNGYICVEFSIIWGLLILLVVTIVQPFIYTLLSYIPVNTVTYVILAIIYAAFLADFTVTVFIVLGFNKKLEILDQLKAEMRIVSDKLSDVLANSTIDTAQKIGEEHLQMKLKKAQMKEDLDKHIEDNREELKAKQEELKKRFDDIISKINDKKIFGPKRLLRAFPHLEHHRYDDLVDLIRDKHNKDNNEQENN